MRNRLQGIFKKFLKLGVGFVVVVIALLLIIKVKYPEISVKFALRPSLNLWPVGSMSFDERKGYYSVEIPKNWSVRNGKLSGGEVSETGFFSPNILVRSGEDSEEHEMVEYRGGAFAIVTVHYGDTESSLAPAESVLKGSGEINIDGRSAFEYNFGDSYVAHGELWESRFFADGRTYVIRFGWDPDSYANGLETYRNFLASFKVKEVDP